jgi:hypothetical protein
VDFRIEDAPDVVVLAGPNGTGKSSVLEAIIFFKERTGPYYGWTLLGDIVNTGADHAEISIKFRVYPEEAEYLKRIHNIELSTDTLEGYMRVAKGGNVVELRVPNGLNQLLSTYRRKDFPNIGIFDFFNPHRFMTRKELKSIGVGAFTDPDEKRRRVSFVPMEKFEMTKDYLAQLRMSDLQSAFVKVSKEGVKVGKEDLPDSLGPIKSIFNSLLTPKKFVEVDFSESPIKFIVETPQGKVDIDDLSSGEKEILFAYTELLKLNLKNSIILFDEPDLHLNQEIERKIVPLLRSIGENNQFWIATHAFGVMDSVQYNELYRVENYSGRNQVTRAFSDEDRYETFRSVAGDVGIVTLGQRIVFLEGTEWADKHILESFFEDYKGKVVFVPSGSVSEVMRISDKILKLLQTTSRFNFYYAIRDRDYMSDAERRSLMEAGKGRLYVWERYHVENYLLDFDAIYNILSRNVTPCPCSNPGDVKEKMVNILRNERDRFLSKMVNYEVNKKLKGVYFDIGLEKIEEQAQTKAENLKNKLLPVLGTDNIKNIIRNKSEEFQRALESSEWVKILPARDVLTLFISRYGQELQYKPFKNQLVHEIEKEKRVPHEVQALSKFLDLS